MKFNLKKYMPAIMKISGSIMTLAVVVANFTQNSTCLALYNQPKVPASLLDKDAE